MSLARAPRALAPAGALGVGLSCALLLACESAKPVACRFGQEQHLFESQKSGFDGVALVQLGGTDVAIFSDASGLQAQRIQPGKGAAAPVRLASRCAGGIDAIFDQRGATLACLRPQTARGAQAHEVAPALHLYALSAALALKSLRAFGVAAAASSGVSLTQTANGIAVAWHDAAPGARRAWYAAVERGASEVEPRVLSDAAQQAGAPALVHHAGDVLATWSESRSDGAMTRTRVMLTWSTRPTQVKTLLRTREEAPMPVLSSTPQGLVLAFRDRRRAGERTGLYALRLDEQGVASGAPRRIARADGSSPPAVAHCAGGLLFATPRRFAGEHFVGVVHSDPRLQQVSGEQQFYEDRREFTRVASACTGSAARLLIAERARPPQVAAALRTVTMKCL